MAVKDVTFHDALSPENGYKWHLIYEDASENKVYSTDSQYFLDVSKNIYVSGNNNSLYLCSGSNISKFIFRIKGNYSKFFIGEDARLIGEVNVSGSRQNFIVGKNTTFQNVTVIIKEHSNVIVGDDCMFSSKIEIRTSDSHSIFDTITGKRINVPGDVIIGNHVWLGKDVIVSKNIIINDNCIVGAKAFVNKSLVDSYCLYAGVPARLIRRNVNWTRELIPIDNE